MRYYDLDANIVIALDPGTNNEMCNTADPSTYPIVFPLPNRLFVRRYVVCSFCRF